LPIVVSGASAMDPKPKASRESVAPSLRVRLNTFWTPKSTDSRRRANLRVAALA